MSPGASSALASDSGLARRVESSSAKTPGSHVTTRVLRPEHPLAWGYDPVTHVFRGNLPVYKVRDFDRGMAVMQFGTKTWAQAEREADRKADVPVDAPPEVFLPALDELEADQWTELLPGGDTICSRGDEFAFFVHPGTSNRVVVDFIGGGACWSEDTCAFATAIWAHTIQTTTARLLMRNVSGMSPSSMWFWISSR